MESGWIKLHRKLLDNIIFSSEKGLKVWVWCLLKASHRETTIFMGRNKTTIKKGSFITGGFKAKEELNLARTTIWYWLDILEAEGLVGIKKTNKHTIITIQNWDRYQEVGNKKETNDTTDGKQKDTYKNDKNDKNDKNSLSIATPGVAGDIKPLMEIFYKFNPSLNWGNKTNRSAADYLIKTLGKEEALKITNYAFSIQGESYAPVITTPYQLKEKLAQLKIYYNRQKTGGAAIL